MYFSYIYSRIHRLNFQVAFLGGLVSHVDGLIDSGIICLHILDRVDGKFICKICKGVTEPLFKY